MRQGAGKSRRHTGKVNYVQSVISPEDLPGATQATAAFLVSVQHMPANDSGHAYNELTWLPIETLDQNAF